MNLKSQEDIIDGLTKKFLKKEDNIYHLERLFMAVSVVRWMFKNAGSNAEILQYLVQVERHLTGEINLYWQDDVIKVGKDKIRGK